MKTKHIKHFIQKIYKKIWLIEIFLLYLRKKDMSRNKTVSEYNRLKRAWKKWNASCHPDDQIDWNEFLEEHA